MENRDEKLWQLASQRAKLKGQVLTYFLVNAFLWAIWYFTAGMHEHEGMIPWPVWASVGWGFALVMRYIRLYHFSSENDIQAEYDKLKNKN